MSNIIKQPVKLYQSRLPITVHPCRCYSWQSDPCHDHYLDLDCHVWWNQTLCAKSELHIIPGHLDGHVSHVCQLIYV